MTAPEGERSLGKSERGTDADLTAPEGALESKMASQKNQNQILAATAEKYMAQINANVDGFYAGTVSYAEFQTVSFRLWADAKADGVAVLVNEMIRRSETK